MRKNFLEAIREVDVALANQYQNANYLTLQNVVNQYNAKISGENPQQLPNQAIPHSHMPVVRPPGMVLINQSDLFPQDMSGGAPVGMYGMAPGPYMHPGMQ